MQPTPMTRIHRRLSFTTRLVIFAIACQCLLGDLQAALQREGDNVVLTDKPRCRFAWPEWDYTNISNPLLLTKNTLDRSMIGIMHIRAGDTLPRGKTKITATMSTQQISALLRENVLGRGQRIDLLTADNTTISGAPAAASGSQNRHRQHAGAPSNMDSSRAVTSFTYSFQRLMIRIT